MAERCIAFEMENAEEAMRHMDLEIIRDYGDYAYGHNLHTWDDGKRLLGRCRKCNAYVLIQRSEFHSFSDSDDSYYTDFFFLESSDDADELNRRYDGFKIETDYPERFLCRSNGRIHWSRRDK